MPTTKEVDENRCPSKVFFTYNVDAVEVVRCKDCKWCDIADYGAGEVLECILDRLYRINSMSLEGETYFREVEPDDFCAWGERREDAETN